MCVNTSTHGISGHDVSTQYIADLCHTPQGVQQGCAFKVCSMQLSSCHQAVLNVQS